MEKKTSLTASLFQGEDDKRVQINEITRKVVGCSFKVANKLGCGFLERVYENALAYEISKLDLEVEKQKEVKVYYDDVEVGSYFPDLLVESKVVVELKTIKKIETVHKAQCFNYLNATGLEVCLLINFGNPRIEVKRIAL